MALSRSDPFYSAKSTLLHAKKRDSELERKIRSFINKAPYKIVVKEQPDDPRSLHVLRFKRRMPSICDHLAGEVLVGLRSTLDRVAYTAAKVSGNSRLKYTQFPIADSRDDLENLITGRKVCRDVPKEIISLFRSFKPYRGGNDSIWAMNKLRNTTHTHLVPIGIAGGNVWIHHAAGAPGLSPTPVVWNDAENELIFGLGGAGMKWNYQVQPTVLVGFDDVQIIGRKLQLGFLNGAISEIERILLATEAECRRLGFLT